MLSIYSMPSRIAALVSSRFAHRVMQPILRTILVVNAVLWLSQQAVPADYAGGVFFSENFFLVVFLLTIASLLLLQDKILHKLIKKQKLWTTLFFATLLYAMLMPLITFSDGLFMQRIAEIDNVFQRVILLIFCVSGLALLWYHRHHLPELDPEEKISAPAKKRQFYLRVAFIVLGIGILILACMPLFSRFLNADEFPIYGVAKGMLTGIRDVAWNFLFDAPGYRYPGTTFLSLIISFSYRLFGVSLFSAKLPSLLFSIINVFLLYYLAKKIAGNKIATLLVLFYCTNPFFIWQSAYIREYSSLITISLLLYIFFLYIMDQHIRSRQLMLYIVGAIALITLGYHQRVFYLTFLPALLVLLWLRFVRSIQSKKTKTWLIASSGALVVVCIALRETIAIEISSFFHLTSFLESASSAFSWHTFNLTFFAVNPLLAKMAILFLVVTLLLSTKKKFRSPATKKIQQLRRENLFFLLVAYLCIQLVYGLLIDQTNMIPRYAIQLILLNFLFFVLGIYFILSLLTKKQSIVYGVLAALLLMANLSLWTRSTINDQAGNEYNFVDMYTDRATDHGRLKENPPVAYTAIATRILPADKKIAIITSFFNDPQLALLQTYSDRFDLIGISKYSDAYDFKNLPCIDNCKKIIINPDEYQVLGARKFLKAEVLKKYADTYDAVFMIWETRKDYKHLNNLANVTDLGFQKISGENFDASNMEVYYYRRPR